MNQPVYIWVAQAPIKSYNPDYGDERLCECGHTYDRHFDSYDKMRAIGCKYCQCDYFVEQKK